MSSQGVRAPPPANVLHEVAQIYYGDDIDPNMVFNLEDLDDLFTQTGFAQDGSVRHEAVTCEPAPSPFPSEEAEATFLKRLQQLLEDDAIPEGYGLLPAELGNEGYPRVQVLNIGRRGGHQEELELPIEMWYPRAVNWARALDSLVRTLEQHGVDL